MKKIKILFLIHNLKHGGAEKVLVNLVNNMDENRFDITVMTIFDVGVNKQFLNKNIGYKSIFSREFRASSQILKLFSPQRLYKKYIKEDYDVIVAYLEGTCTRIIGGCDKSGTVKIGWRHIAETNNEFIYTYRSKKEALEIYNNLDFVACVSEDVKKNFIELSGFDVNKTQVLYNTNETDKIKELAEVKVEKEEFNYDGIKIIGVAKIRARKGFFRLARVHKKLISEGYRYKIYLLGEGEEKKEIEDYLRANNLSDSFIFLGYDTNPYKYVSKCDLFVCSSFEEGFSTAATEALIVGTPVLTTLCAGMKEMLGENDEYGVIVENSEEGIYLGLKKFLDNTELLSHYKQQSLIRSEMFSCDKTVKAVEDKIIELYKKKQVGR